MTVQLRLFCSVGTEHDATSVMATVCLTIQHLGHVATFTPKQYWKIPEYYECVIEVSGQSEQGLLAAVMRSVANGWTRVNAESFVWNFSDETEFIDHRVRWAETCVIGPQVDGS